jgi:hypothetical protein
VRRHRFEPVAFVLGVVFVAAGVIVLAGGELTEEGRALVPAGLIALGVALLVHVGRRGRPPAPAAAPPVPQVDDRDLDDLFAPVDDALADWDRANAAAGTRDSSPPTTPDTDATQADATQVDITEAHPTEADATQVDIAEVHPTEADATQVDIAEVHPTEADATTAEPEPDVTEVVDPTERYPRREPE